MFLSAQQLAQRIRERVDVEASEVDEREGGEYAVLASTAVYHTLMRRSADALARVCAAEGFTSEPNVNLAMQLAQIAQNERPIPAVLKGLGLRAVEQGQFDRGIALLENAVLHASRISAQPDARSRSTLAYLQDREIDAAYAKIGALVPGVTAVRPPDAPLRHAVLMTTLDDASATTHIMLPIVRGLRDRGIEVVVASTEHTPSGESIAIPQLADMGVPVVFAHGANHYQRLRSLIDTFQANPVDAVLYYHWPLDAVGKLATVSRLAPGQVFMNHTCEQSCGTFDVVLHSSSRKQLERSIMRADHRYCGPASSTRELIENAVPFDRAAYGCAPDEILLGTFGRISKCCDDLYLKTMARIVREVPKTKLLLAGPTAPEFDAIVHGFFAAEGLLDRVRMLGNLRNAYYGLVKMIDIYCDTLFWRGGQSVLEAMVAAKPVVAMASVEGDDVDPSGVGAISNSVGMLPDEFPVAPPGDADAYVALVARYAADPALRSLEGEWLREHAKPMRMETIVDFVDDALRDAAKRTPSALALN